VNEQTATGAGNDKGEIGFFLSFVDCSITKMVKLLSSGGTRAESLSAKMWAANGK